MELVTGLFTTAFGAGAGTAAVGTAAAATATGGSFLSIASTIGTAFTALSTIGAGVAAANETKAAAKYAEFKATDERIKGDQEAARLKKTLALTVQRNRVAMASGGVDLSSASQGQIEKQVAMDAERELGMSYVNAQSAALAGNAEARRLRKKASSQLFADMTDGFMTFAQGAMEGVARG
jgi:hypothetical protein